VKTINNKTNTLTISPAFKKEVTKLINTDKKVNEFTDKRETNSLTMINIAVGEVLELKKQVIVPATIVKENHKSYKTREVKKALIALSDNNYYKSIVDTAIHYIESNYKLDFKSDESISLTLLKRVLDEKPTKKSVESKTNKEIKEILDTNKANKKTATQKEIKAKLSTDAKNIFDKLSTDDIALIKAYFAA